MARRRPTGNAYVSTHRLSATMPPTTAVLGETDVSTNASATGLLCAVVVRWASMNTPKSRAWRTFLSRADLSKPLDPSHGVLERTGPRVPLAGASGARHRQPSRSADQCRPESPGQNADSRTSPSEWHARTSRIQPSVFSSTTRWLAVSAALASPSASPAVPRSSVVSSRNASSQRARLTGLCAAFESSGRTFSDQPSVVENSDRVGDRFDNREDMRREKDGRSRVGEFRNHPRSVRAARGSSPDVGSSKKTTSGSWRTACM